jgi:hypothetical protein
MRSHARYGYSEAVGVRAAGCEREVTRTLFENAIGITHTDLPHDKDVIMRKKPKVAEAAGVRWQSG